MNLRIIPILFFTILACSCGPRSSMGNKGIQNDSIPPLGFWEEDFTKMESTVRNGETFNGLMSRHGLSGSEAQAILNRCDTLFDVRKMRAGNRIRAYYSGDSLSRALEYLVYDKNRISSTIFKCKDSIAVWNYSKPVKIDTLGCDVTIQASLWNDMLEAGTSPLLIISLSDVFAWTVDFFSLQKGDRFRAKYRTKSVEGEVIDIQGIDFAIFSRGAHNEYAIRLDQGDGGNQYWNEKGESMRKAFLKAPLKFSRVSSKFSYHRKHPVSGVVKPHTGVDYAAPAGTPVHALGDGTVISAGWGGGGGNTIKIRHNSVYTTGYLHLKGFAKGIKSGVRVHQGQLIGYVGSTGTSTGPHLDFRVWKNGTPVNPLTLESPSAEPIKQANKAALDSLFTHYCTEFGIDRQ